MVKRSTNECRGASHAPNAGADTWVCPTPNRVRHQKGSIIISTIMLILALSVLGISLQQFLRGQIRNQYGTMGDSTGTYNMPVDDANAEAKYMAEFGLNWTVWLANDSNTNPGAGGYPVTFPTTGPSPTPDPGVNPGYADPDRNIYPFPDTVPVATPTPATYWKRYTIESPAPNKLKVTGEAIVRGNTSGGATKKVSRTVYADWAGGAGSLYYLKKSTWKEDQ